MSLDTSTERTSIKLIRLTLWRCERTTCTLYQCYTYHDPHETDDIDLPTACERLTPTNSILVVQKPHSTQNGDAYGAANAQAGQGHAEMIKAKSRMRVRRMLQAHQLRDHRAHHRKRETGTQSTEKGPFVGCARQEMLDWIHRQGHRHRLPK